MKVTFRIREEITRENNREISRFYCETKSWLLGWSNMCWSNMFFQYLYDDLDDECSPLTQVYFNTKQEARMAILERYRTPTTEVRYH